MKAKANANEKLTGFTGEVYTSQGEVRAQSERVYETEGEPGSVRCSAPLAQLCARGQVVELLCA